MTKHADWQPMPEPEPIKAYVLLEWDTSTSSEDPRRWGPFASEKQRDDQIAIACCENIHRRLLCIDITINYLLDIEMHQWTPSEAYRDDLVRKIDSIIDGEAEEVSELTDENATRMWSADRPPEEAKRLQSLLRQVHSERGEDE